ncbi:MAG TPA: hypothetical protein VMT46_14985 [Anaerolineaceae bacterium]|nr:hypothetical protein [Anaerolineaceae bacterium]
MVVLATLGIILVFATIFANPSSGFNPFPPVAMPPTVALPTNTPTAKYFPPTWTPTITPVPTETMTPEPPTATPTRFVLSVTPNSLTSTAQAAQPSPVVTPTIKSNFPFAVPNQPASAASTIIHSDLGCKWLGIGGQVFDLSGAPVVGIYIKLGGSVYGKPVDMLSLTGTALQYGPAGYEFRLGDTPVDTKQQLWVQLFDQADLPLSDKIYFDTFKDCAKNLTIINFKQVK